MKRITILLLLVLIFNGCATKQDDHSSVIPTKQPDVSSEPILSEEIIEEDVEETGMETATPEITVTPPPRIPLLLSQPNSLKLQTSQSLLRLLFLPKNQNLKKQRK